MRDNPQFITAAQHMIDRYGDDAILQTEERIEELSRSDNGDSEACKIWRQVRQAIIALLEQPSDRLTH